MRRGNKMFIRQCAFTGCTASLFVFGTRTPARTDASSLIRSADAQNNTADTPDQQEADRLYGAAMSALGKKNYKEAEPRMMLALEKARILGDPPRLARILHNWGDALLDQGRFEDALKMHQEALPVLAQLKRRNFEAISYIQISACYRGLLRYSDARSNLLRALTIYEEIGALDQVKYKESVLHTLDQIDSTLFSEGKHDGEALRYHERALALRQKWGADALNLARCYRNIGVVCDSLGRYDDAFHAFSQALAALDTATDADNERFAAATLHDLGKIYFGWGQYLEAKTYIERGIKKQGHLIEQCREQKLYADPTQERGDLTLQVDMIDSLGGVTLSLRQTKAAERTLEQAQTAADALHYTDGLIARQNNFALLDMMQRRFQDADKILRNIPQQGLTPSLDQAITKCSQGILALLQDKYDRAITCFQQAIPQFESGGNDLCLAKTYTALGIAFYNLDRVPEAEAEARKACDHYEKSSAQIPDPTRMGLMRGTLLDPYKVLAAVLHRQHHSVEALMELEHGRGQGLARQAARNRVAFGQLDSGERGRLRELENHAEEADKGARAQRLPDLLLQWNRAQQALNAYEGELRVRHPQFGSYIGQPPPRDLFETLTRQHPDTLYLSWAMIDDKTMLLFALGRQNKHFFVHSYPLSVRQSVLRAQINAWRESIFAAYRLTLSAEHGGYSLSKRTAASEQAAQEPELASTVGRALLDPVEQDGLLRPGRFRRLVMIPDPVLFSVPFAALGAAGGKRLVDWYPVSCGLSLVLEQSAAPPRRAVAPLLCAADPDLPKTLTDSSKGGSALMASTNTSLDLTRRSVLKIATLFPGATVWPGPNALSSRILKEMDKYALLLFATHGKANADDGLRSCLYFAPDSAAHPEDAQLTARDIVGMQLAAHLAVLWGCETGQGEPQEGEGELGLIWAFHAAGCHSVVASIWQVDEEPTSQLMLSFYNGLKAKKPKDEALRAAIQSVRQDMRQRKGYESPFWWAGFQVYGDTAPLPDWR